SLYSDCVSPDRHVSGDLFPGDVCVLDLLCSYGDSSHCIAHARTWPRPSVPSVGLSLERADLRDRGTRNVRKSLVDSAGQIIGRAWNHFARAPILLLLAQTGRSPQCKSACSGCAPFVRNLYCRCPRRWQEFIMASWDIAATKAAIVSKPRSGAIPVA